MSEILNVKVDKITKINDGSKLKAVVDLVFGDLFLIKGFRIVESDKGMYVGMPQQDNKDRRPCPTCGTKTQRVNTFVPASQEIREYLKEVILDAYVKSEE